MILLSYLTDFNKHVTLFHSASSTRHFAGTSTFLHRDQRAIKLISRKFRKHAYATQKFKVTASKTLEELQWDNSFVKELPADPSIDPSQRQVTGAMYTRVSPSPQAGSEPHLIAVSHQMMEELELDPTEADRPEFPLFLSGHFILPGCSPFAQCYGGHQFGQWAGQLGDGRAISLGEVVNSEGRRWELQLKGAGKTPYSRQADGRAVLRSSLREFVASEAFHHLRIPTTRALSLCATGHGVERDMFYNGNRKSEPGAVVCRTAASFLRFGSFELPASRGGDNDIVGLQLLDYAIEYHFPSIANQQLTRPEKAFRFLEEVVKRTAHLLCCWQSVGFTHGVLNSDNMSVIGLTIDFGPFGFLEEFNPLFTPNVSDLDGLRYSYQNQPDIVQWNLSQLAKSLVSIGALEHSAAQQALNTWRPILKDEYFSTMNAKLGLSRDADPEIFRGYLRLMRDARADFTLSFRLLSNLPSFTEAMTMSGPELLAPLYPALPADLSQDMMEAYSIWVRMYLEQVAEEDLPDNDRRLEMDRLNPLYIPRNYLMQEAIEAAELGEYSPLEELLEVLQQPFTYQEGKDKFCEKAPEWAKKLAGVAVLSCSS